jgi:hypothetical protein
MAPERVKGEPGIWQRGDVFEITFRDAQGKQRRRTFRGGITAARNELAKKVAKRANGERVTADRDCGSARLRTRGLLARSRRCARTRSARTRVRSRATCASASRSGGWTT